MELLEKDFFLILRIEKRNKVLLTVGHIGTAVLGSVLPAMHGPIFGPHGRTVPKVPAMPPPF